MVGFRSDQIEHIQQLINDNNAIRRHCRCVIRARQAEIKAAECSNGNLLDLIVLMRHLELIRNELLDYRDLLIEEHKNAGASC
jgi:hypothetical protein